MSQFRHSFASSLVTPYLAAVMFFILDHFNEVHYAGSSWLIILIIGFYTKFYLLFLALCILVGVFAYTFKPVARYKLLILYIAPAVLSSVCYFIFEDTINDFLISQL